MPGVALPQLGINGNDIVFSKAEVVKGDRITVNATVHNTGEGASDVTVVTYIGDPAQGGIQIGSNSIPYLGPSETAVVQTDWVIDQPAGAYDVYFWVDPLGIVPEDNKADNIAHKTVVVDQKPLALSVTIDRSSYSSNMDATIHITVRNDSSTFWTGTEGVTIEDLNGAVVAQLAPSLITGLAPSGLAGWPYRVPVSVTAPWNMKNGQAQTAIDFGAALAQVGAPGATVDVNSIRVVEFDSSGNVIGEKNAKATFTSSTTAKVVWLMDGTTNSGTTRSFFIYFDTLDHGVKQPSLKRSLPMSGNLIVFSNETGKIFVAESYGDGTFGAPRQIDALTSAGYVRGIVLDDFNGDGFLDIVTGSGQIGAVYLYRNKADGTNAFNGKVQVGTIASSTGLFPDMVSADFNGDGRMDFVANSNVANTLLLFTGNGDGTFVMTNITPPAGTHNLRGKTAADVNNDGFIDLIVSDLSGYIYLYKNKGNGTFDAPVQVGSLSVEVPGLVGGDFNGDGKVDILASKVTVGDTYLFPGNGDGTFAAPVLVPSLDTNSSTAFDVGDFNNDGRLDIIAATSSNKTIEFYPGNGDGTFGTKTIIATTTESSLGISSSPALAEVRPLAGAAEKIPDWSAIVTWNTGSTPAGDYRVHATVTEEQGILAENTASFAIAPDKAASATVFVDKTAYGPNETAAVTSIVTSRSVNFIFENVTASVSIGTAAGTVYTDARIIATLMPGGSYRFNSYWNTGSLAPGTYPVTLEVKDASGAEVATGSRDLVISSNVNAASALKGQISVDKQSLHVRRDADCIVQRYEHRQPRSSEHSALGQDRPCGKPDGLQYDHRPGFACHGSIFCEYRLDRY